MRKYFDNSDIFFFKIVGIVALITLSNILLFL